MDEELVDAIIIQAEFENVPPQEQPDVTQYGEEGSSIIDPHNLPSLIPEDSADNSNINFVGIFQRPEYLRTRNDARESTQNSANRMIARSMWRNDHLEFPLGSRVLIRPSIDANEQTRVRSLYDHLDRRVYVVIEVLQFNRVKLCSELSPEDIIESMDTIRDIRLGNN